MEGRAGRALSLDTKESTRWPHFSKFICSTVFRAATYVSQKSDRYIFFIILNFLCVGLSAAEAGKLRLFFETGEQLNKSVASVADDTNIQIAML